MQVEWEPKYNLLRMLFREINSASKGPAIFLDRDGVINCRRPDDYVLDWSQFNFVPGICVALKRLGAFGLPMIVVSNQAAVGKGLLDRERLREISTRMQQRLIADGISLTAAYYCIHRADEACHCRKPKPGLLEQAAADFHIDLGQSVFVGDSDTDAQAAKAACCTPVMFGSPIESAFGAKHSLEDLAHSPSATELFDVVAKCLPARSTRL